MSRPIPAKTMLFHRFLRRSSPTARCRICSDICHTRACEGIARRWCCGSPRSASPWTPTTSLSLTAASTRCRSRSAWPRRLMISSSPKATLIPENLDRAFTETQARVLYCMPTLQTPTGTVMPPQRRQAIAEIVRRHDAYLLEDDAYGYLLSPPLTPVSRLIPERSFYIVSFAKCLAPGLRIAAMIAPEAFRDRSINALRATGWMAVPVMAEVVARLIANGGLARQARLKRDKAALRDAIVRRVLKEWLPAASAAPGFHIWLPLPAGRTLAALIAQAAQAGITLAPPGTLQRMERESLGVRLCLGAPATEADLERALIEIRRILEMAEAISFV